MIAMQSASRTDFLRRAFASLLGGIFLYAMAPAHAQMGALEDLDAFPRARLEIGVTKKSPLAFEVWLADTPARQVWKNGYGECWHSAFGPPPGYTECNPAPVAQYVPPPPAPAPVVVTPPPPQPAPVLQPAPMPPRHPRG